jgi:hypothetical protein
MAGNQLESLVAQWYKLRDTSRRKIEPIRRHLYLAKRKTRYKTIWRPGESTSRLFFAAYQFSLLQKFRDGGTVAPLRFRSP